MRARQVFKLLALLAGCLFLTACPPVGGELLPLAQDGAALATSRFQNDTLSVTHESFNIRAHGNWKATDAHTSVTLEIRNARAGNAVIRFDDCELFNQESHEKLSLRAVVEDKEGAGPAFLKERSVTVAGGESKRYNVSFFIKASDGGSSVTRDVLGERVRLRVPVRLTGADSAPVDFLFDFKYVEYQR